MTRKLGPKYALIKGAFWTVGTRWSIKGLGLINTAIMARLLVPNDYGVVAMAMLMVGLVQSMVDFSASTALLRKDEVTQTEIDSAWTLGVIEGLIVGTLLLISIPFASAYFQEPRLAGVLGVFAACVMFSQAGNIGMTLAQKAFDFSRSFRLGVAAKVLGVVATVSAGLVFRDYRALVIGVATGYVSGMVLSYVMHPYRPRWNTRGIPAIWAVTKWLMVAGVGGFVLRKGDELMAARLGNAQEFGLYNVGSDLGQMPTGEVGPALLRAFLPVLATIEDDAARTHAAVLKTLSAINTITLPMGLGFAALAAPATALVLGPNWHEAAQFVALFSIVSVVQIFASPLTTLLTLRGHTRLQSRIVWLEFVAFLLAAFALYPLAGLIGLVLARIAAGLVSAAATVLAVRKMCGLPMRHVAAAVWRPLVGAAVMFVLVEATLSWVATPWAQVALAIGVGAMSFALWIGITWQLLGRPEGLESTVYDHVMAWKSAKS